MDLLSVIRRWHGRDRLSIREFSLRTGLSRNTIRKYLSNGEVEPRYPARQSASKLDPYAEVLASWLAREAKRGRKQRRNLKQLHRDLEALGFDGSYDRVAAFARDWRQREREQANRASRGAYVPLSHADGLAAAVRRLRRVQQAGLADLSRHLRAYAERIVLVVEVRSTTSVASLVGQLSSPPPSGGGAYPTRRDSKPKNLIVVTRKF